MRLPFETEAAAEFKAAVAWHEREGRGRGLQFMSEVRYAVARAAELPRSGVLVPGTYPGRDVRRFVVRCFPYAVVSAVMVGQRAVVAVVHGRRRPGYWRARVM